MSKPGATPPLQQDADSTSRIPDSPTELDAMDSESAFQLPLVPFEHYMMLEDQADYPMVFVFRLILRGEINKQALQCSINEATRRHPLLHSLLVTGNNGQLTWQAVDQTPKITWIDDSAKLSSLLWQQVDLNIKIGLEVYIHETAEQTRLYFRMHHACCDGMGAYSYFEDFLAIYEAHDDPTVQEPNLKKLNPELLKGRGDFEGPTEVSAEAPPLSRRFMDFLGGTKEAVKFLLQPPRPLAPEIDSQKKTTEPVEAGFLTHSLPEEYLPVLRRKAEEAGVSLNDLLLRDLFLTLRTWNQQHQFGSDKSRLQIMMPTGLRGVGDKEMPAANMLSYAFLIRPAEACDHPEELLQSLGTETKAIIRYKYPLLFIGAITFLLKSPFLFRRLLRTKRCFGTVVLTNLGDPTRRFVRRFTRKKGLIHVGGAVLEEITGIPPLRPLTGAVFSAITYSNKLQIGLRCDPVRFTPEATRRLLALLIEQLEQSAA